MNACLVDIAHWVPFVLIRGRYRRVLIGRGDYNVLRHGWLSPRRARWCVASFRLKLLRKQRNVVSRTLETCKIDYIVLQCLCNTEIARACESDSVICFGANAAAMPGAASSLAFREGRMRLLARHVVLCAWCSQHTQVPSVKPKYCLLPIKQRTAALHGSQMLSPTQARARMPRANRPASNISGNGSTRSRPGMPPQIRHSSMHGRHLRFEKEPTCDFR